MAFACYGSILKQFSVFGQDYLTAGINVWNDTVLLAGIMEENKPV